MSVSGNRADLTEQDPLADYVHLLWRRRRFIGGVVLVAILVSAIFSFVILQPVYEAVTLLLISEPRFQGSATNLATRITPPLSVNNLIPVVHNEVVAAAVATRLAGAMSSTPRELVRRVRLSQVRGTNLLRVTARGRTPEAAVVLAVAWSEAIVAHIDALNLDETRRTLSLLEDKIASFAADLIESENALREFRAQSKIPILQQRVDEIVRRMALYEARLTEAEQGVTQAGGEVSLQPRGNSYTLTVTSVRDPVSIRRILVTLTGELAVNQQTLATERQRETELFRRVELARSTHQLLVQKGEETRILLGANTGMVKIAVPAQLPISPAGPRRAFYLALGGILGLVAGTVLAFVVEYLTMSSPRILHPPSKTVGYHRSKGSNVQT